MPYKDPERKKEWEQKHRNQRLTRRRELRTRHASEKAQNGTPRAVGSPIGLLWLPLVAGGALAVYSPTLAIGAGALTLSAAASYKKEWTWWLVGIVTIGLAIYFLWSDRKRKK